MPCWGELKVKRMLGRFRAERQMRRQFRRRRTATETSSPNPTASKDPESGEATVEFIAMTIVILIPLAYFIFTIAAVQSAVLASEAAARETGRIMANKPEATAHVSRQADQIFSDYRVDGAHTVTVQCEPQPCANADLIQVRVEVHVELPLIPDALRGALMPTIPVIADYAIPVSKLQLVE